MVVVTCSLGLETARAGQRQNAIVTRAVVPIGDGTRTVGGTAVKGMGGVGMGARRSAEKM